MPVTISLYNQAREQFLSGKNAPSDTYKLQLLTAATFDATHTTLAGAGGTEVANGNGYTTGGATLTNVTVSIINTDEAKFDADDVIWTATGSGIQAGFGRIYNDTDSGKPVVAFINFDGSKTAIAGTEFKVIWNAAGIITATKPV